MGSVLAAAMKKIRKSAGRFMHSTSAIRPLVRPSTSLRTVGLMSLRVPWWRRSPTLGFAVFEEGHQLVQDLHELVDMGAGLRYQISTLFEGQVRRNRAVVAPEHQSVVEGLMVTQVRTRALAALLQLGGSEKCYL
jgi:hypothetical protein